ncbi:peroxisomal membrane protein [Seiridium cupressi]|uniref:Peroxisomal membrane protein PEX16 n=1 Tax=Seiridium unicorne TaxID=138068 RepID=A0ABR2VGI0_9PEZI
MAAPADPLRSAARSSAQPPRQNPIRQVLSLPPRWLHMYSEFITKNAQSVSQIESALRSLTYVIPGRFRDAEIASESIHSGVQLLSLYHDAVLLRALARIPGLASRIPSPHARYTRFWTAKSRVYRQIALLLQIVQYTELLWEMAAKRRGEKVRWRVIILLEAVKAICKLLLLRITNSRPLVTPVLPEREPIPEQEDGQSNEDALKELMGEEVEESPMDLNGSAKSAHEKEWSMPRTGTNLPSLPNPGDISSYLLSKVLTADDIKPASKLLNSLQGSAQAAEALHILAPLIYALALARSKDKKSWTPWLIGLSFEYAARQIRDKSFRATALEREEWNKRAWAMGWWVMRGPAYENVMKGVVGGFKRRMPSFVGSILEDYEYLWENYYFSTSG